MNQHRIILPVALASALLLTGCSTVDSAEENVTGIVTEVEYEAGTDSPLCTLALAPLRKFGAYVPGGGGGGRGGAGGSGGKAPAPARGGPVAPAPVPAKQPAGKAPVNGGKAPAHGTKRHRVAEGFVAGGVASCYRKECWEVEFSGDDGLHRAACLDFDVWRTYAVGDRFPKDA